MTTVVIVNGSELEPHRRQALQDVYGAHGEYLVYGDTGVSANQLRALHGPDAAYIQAEELKWDKIAQWHPENQPKAEKQGVPVAKIAAGTALGAAAVGLGVLAYRASQKGDGSSR